ncbi:hypothetical protein STENM223S_09768 [Streptomyces tendae]
MTDETTEPAVDAPEAAREEQRADAVTALTAPPPGWANPLRDPLRTAGCPGSRARPVWSSSG